MTTSLVSRPVLPYFTFFSASICLLFMMEKSFCSIEDAVLLVFLFWTKVYGKSDSSLVIALQDFSTFTDIT